MEAINKPVNSVFVFNTGAAEKMKSNKTSKEVYSEINRQAELLRKRIDKRK